MRRHLSRRSRDEIIWRAQRRCEYCLTPTSCSSSPFAVDHILPLARGGTDVMENLALSCFGCNGPKSAFTEAIDPETGTLVRLYHPRRDSWREHFRWNNDFTELVGLTPIGRATIVRLDLNRAGVMTLRRLMIGTEEGHPPAWTLPEVP